jgi:hypothetical protein
MALGLPSSRPRQTMGAGGAADAPPGGLDPTNAQSVPASVEVDVDVVAVVVPASAMGMAGGEQSDEML